MSKCGYSNAQIDSKALAEENFMAKKRQKNEVELRPTFRLTDVKHHANRGMHAALSAIETAIQNGRIVLHEVWQWVVTNFAKNLRAIELLKIHAPTLVPVEKAVTAGREVISNLHLPIRRKG